MEIQQFSAATISSNMAVRPTAAPQTQKVQEEVSVPSDQISLNNGDESQSDVRSLRILHINDIHGAVEADADNNGGLAKAATVIKNERAEMPNATLTLNAGDIAEGSMVAYLTQGGVVSEALSNIGFDAIEPGNHDFAWGQDALQKMLTDSNAPVLNANIINSADGSTLGQPYMIKDINGVKVGMIGVDVQNMHRYIASEKLEGLEFHEPAEAVAEYLPKLKEAGCDLLMVVSHIGFEDDKKLAQQFPELDIIVGGHSHTVLEQGHYEGNTLIVQSGTKGQYVGELDLDFDLNSRKIVKAEPRLITVDSSVEPDPEVSDIIARSIESVSHIGNQVMGVAEEDLHFSHTGASMLNQIHADSVFDKTKEMGAEIALVSARNLRGDVPAGEVTYTQLFSAFPHTEEDTCIMRVKGSLLLEEMEERVQDGGRGPATPAGFTYTYDPELPSGHRITDVTMADGSKFDPDREYTVGTTISMMRKSRFNGASLKQTVGSSQEMFMDAFKAGSPWTDTPDSRVSTVQH
ncbi:bifunctional metallophosphatase/5'-nucleotidase [bacterium]|nr:bifunctional metallophosphatase/5'-nucleotidase [bacterium]